MPPCVSKPLGKAEVLIPMKDLVNKEAELKRLGEMAAKLEGMIKGGEAKLNNEAFVSKAPAKIIEGAKAQLEGQDPSSDRRAEQALILSFYAFRSMSSPAHAPLACKPQIRG